MLAYVELVQRKEKEIGCDVLTHQKWFVRPLSPKLGRLLTDTIRSGASYIDRIISTISSGSSSTSSTGKLFAVLVLDAHSHIQSR